MKSIFRKGKFLLLVLILFGNIALQTGCGFKDIDKRLFVLAIGIDQEEGEEDQYRVTLKLAVPSGSLKESSGTMYSYLTEDSSNMADAIRKLKSQVDKEFDFGHLKTIVIGEKLLNDDLSAISDIFLRRRDFQRVSWMAVGRPTAEDVLKTEPGTEMPASVVLFNMFSDTGVESPYIVTTHLFDFRRKVLESGISPMLPIVQADEKKTKLLVNHAVVLNDTKEAVELNPRQTKVLNILNNEVDKLGLLIRGEDREFVISVDEVKSKFKILTADHQRTILKMNVDLAGIVEESDEYLKAKELTSLSKQASKEVEKWVRDLLVLLQEKQVDPLGFGLRYRATRLENGGLQKKWEKELYPNMEFDLSVNVDIKSTGVIE